MVDEKEIENTIISEVLIKSDFENVRIISVKKVFITLDQSGLLRNR